MDYELNELLTKYIYSSYVKDSLNLTTFDLAEPKGNMNSVAINQDHISSVEYWGND